MKSTPLLRRCVFALFLWAVLSSVAQAEEYPLWGKLQAGKYRVGFQARWEFDYSRTYRLNLGGKAAAEGEKAPRPILLNVWYPAEATEAGPRMQHRGYLEVPADDPRVSRLAEELAKYNRGVIAQEVTGKALDKLTEGEKRLFDGLLDSPTACRRGAKPAAGKFPLVLYHAGYGSSFEDNAVLCEYLASHGFVVVGSAFQEPTGATFNVDGKATSARDLGFLIAAARQLPFVDWQHVGVMGHSGGAHASLMFRAEANSAVDALVSLDTTQDYYSLADPRWGIMTETVAKGRQNFTGPLLIAANPHAYYSMIDTLDRSPRYYLTLKHLGHNDFIAQGCLSRELRAKLPGKTPTNEDKVSPAEVRASYEALCVCVLRFLQAHLQGDNTAWTGLVEQYQKTPLGGPAPHVEVAPAGEVKPPSYREGSANPPTPRQLRPFFREHGVEKTLALLRRVRQEHPASPLFENVYAFALVYDLLEEGKNQEARALHAYYSELIPEFRLMFHSLADFLAKMNRRPIAINYYKKALILDPDNAELAKKLREAEKETGK